MKNHRDVRFDEDWKVVTVYIGANDLCSICNGELHHRPEQAIDGLERALDVFKREVPRM